MNRTDLIRHLEAHGCRFVRGGGKHTIYKNPASGAFSSVPPPPRDQEISGSQNLR
ncbi:MAG: type II toxin-antitoxin system HicA family toxin [Pyrinomonadaceae bacterium]